MFISLHTIYIYIFFFFFRNSLIHFLNVHHKWLFLNQPGFIEAMLVFEGIRAIKIPEMKKRHPPK